MPATIAAIAGICCISGIFLVVVGSLKRVPAQSTGTSTGLWTSAQRWLIGSDKRGRISRLVALVAGIAVFAVTRWAIFLVVVPALILVLPALLRTPRRRDIEQLEALDRWIRLIASSLPTGKSIPDAIRATRRQAPETLAAPLQLLVARLDDRWTIREALFAFANDLDSVDADAVIAALVLAAERGGRGASAILVEIAKSVQDRLRALREIESEREKPRIVVRQVTAISFVVLGGVALLSPTYFAPLRSAVGQIVIAVCAAMYIGSLWQMQRSARPRKQQRLLASAPLLARGEAR